MLGKICGKYLLKNWVKFPQVYFLFFPQNEVKLEGITGNLGYILHGNLHSL